MANSFSLNHKSNFLFIIDVLPNVTFYQQRINIPDVLIGKTFVPSPLGDYEVHGDKLSFSELSVEYIVDENLENYYEAFNLLYDTRNPIDISKRNDNVFDCSISILNNQRTPIMRFNFHDAFINSVGGIELDTTAGGENQISNMILTYKYFDIEKLT